MKKLGIIGGIGWPSTVEYYRLICQASELYHSNQQFAGPTPMPEMVIESLNMNFTVNKRGTSEDGSWSTWDAYFNQAIKRLVASGAELIIMASVTPHARLQQICQGISVPVLSVYEAIGAYCSQAGIKQLLVLGTMPTMSSAAFQISMKPFNVSALYPPNEALKFTVVETIGRLYQHKTSGAGEGIAQVVRASIAEVDLEKYAVCLGCTELPLAFPESSGEASFTVNGITYLNTSVIHASYAFQACLDSGASAYCRR